MEISERDKTIIEKILEYCNQIGETHERFDDSYERFVSDFIYRNALCLCLLQIGELSNKISPEFKEDHINIPWRAIRGMRNTVAHEYGHLDIPTLWETSHRNIRELEQFCTKILSEQEEQGFTQSM